MPRYPTPITAPIPAWNQQTLVYYALQRLRRPRASSAGSPAQLTMQSLQEAGGRTDWSQRYFSGLTGMRQSVVATSHLVESCVAWESGQFLTYLGHKHPFFLFQ